MTRIISTEEIRALEEALDPLYGDALLTELDGYGGHMPVFMRFYSQAETHGTERHLPIMGCSIVGDYLIIECGSYNSVPLSVEQFIETIENAYESEQLDLEEDNLICVVHTRIDNNGVTTIGTEYVMGIEYTETHDVFSRYNVPGIILATNATVTIS